MSALLKSEEDQGSLKGVSVCRSGPVITNLLFADDSLILMHGNATNAISLKKILDDYCSASGQRVSEAKSSIYFSPNTKVDDKVEVCQILNIMTESLSDKYLGLPSMVGLDKSDSFGYLLERIIKRLANWNEKILSLGGKEILLKAIIQSIPVYAMGVFQIPKKLCKEMTDAMSSFWWGDTEDHRRMHWMAWWHMCIPKKDGGMGFRDLHSFNLAMLAKQSWRLISQPDSLCARVLKAKYYPNCNILKASPKKGSSFTWQSIMAGLNTFKRGHIWRVGNGESINIWEDHWVPGSPSRMIITPRQQVILRTVDELIDPHTHDWDEQLVRNIFNPVDAARILCIPLNENMTEDFVAWHLSKTYTFTVRSAYYAQWTHTFGHKINRTDGQGSSRPNPVWDILWKLKVPAKVKIFVWKALHGTIPGLAILANRHIKTSAQCPICKQGPEDVKHLMFTCSRARQVWEALGVLEAIDGVLPLDRSGSVVLEEILRNKDPTIASLGTTGFKEVIAVGSWYIWWQRREAVNGVAVAPPTRSAFAILALAANYHGAVKGTLSHEIPWSKPPLHTYKLNTDACFFPNGVGAVGVVLRNDKGEAIAGGCWPLTNLFDATTAEALALQKGFMLIEQLGCSPVTIETDSLELVQAFNGVFEVSSPYTAILVDCFLRSSRLGVITVQHCNREANRVAHNLARNAFDSNLSYCWDGEPPSFIMVDVINDVTFVDA